jgi:paraquat-inducible protein B
MSDDEDADALEIIPLLQLVVEELSRCHSRAKVLLAAERRTRRQEPRKMAETLDKLRGKLAKVTACLDEAEEIPSEEKKNQREKKIRSSKREGVTTRKMGQTQLQWSRKRLECEKELVQRLLLLEKLS